MKVILLENVKGVGKKDQVIEANDGYARNFLLPKKKAVEANKANLSKLKSKQESNDFKRSEEKENALEIKEKISKINLKFEVNAGENGKIFGGITSKDISEKLEKDFDIKIDKKKIDLKNAIKETGNFTVDIKLFEGVVAKLRIVIASK